MHVTIKGKQIEFNFHACIKLCFSFVIHDCKYNIHVAMYVAA